MSKERVLLKGVLLACAVAVAVMLLLCTCVIGSMYSSGISPRSSSSCPSSSLSSTHFDANASNA